MCCEAVRRTKSALRLVEEFATAASKVRGDELRLASERVALQGIKVVEEYANHCVLFLLQALEKAQQASSSSVGDVLWMLYKLAKNDDARGWILESHGLKLLLNALLLHYTDESLLSTGVWLAYGLDGARGFAFLLMNCRGATPDHAAVRAAVIWAVHSQVTGETRASYTRGRQQEERAVDPDTLELLVEALRPEGTPRPALWACCRALEKLVTCSPKHAQYFADREGAQMLTRLLVTTPRQGKEAADIRLGVGYLIAALAEASASVAEVMRQAGVLHALVEHGVGASGEDGDEAVEAVMWAIGALGGLPAVVELMVKHGSARPAVLRGGTLAIGEVTWYGMQDKEDARLLPQALSLVLGILGNDKVVAGRLRDLVKSLGALLACMAPSVSPGSLPDMDCGVECLVRRFQSQPPRDLEEPPSGARPDDVGFSASPAVTEMAAAEAIGRIALGAPEWRIALRRCGCIEGLRLWIRSGLAIRRLQKYLFWAAAAIGGLPLVAVELKQDITNVNLVDAALCTIIDILDDDIDGEYSLRGVDDATTVDVAPLIGQVLEAMRAHTAAPEVQARGAQCVGFLLPALAADSMPALVPMAAVAALGGARRFPTRGDVAFGCCAALRALCELRTSAAAAKMGTLAALQSVLLEEGAAEWTEQVMSTFAQGSGKEYHMELLENAVSIFAQLRGVEPALRRLQSEYRGSALRPAGLKALFELGRANISLFASSACRETTKEVCLQCLQEAEEGSDRLQEVAALLSGLCTAAASQQVQQQ